MKPPSERKRLQQRLAWAKLQLKGAIANLSHIPHTAPELRDLDWQINEAITYLKAAEYILSLKLERMKNETLTKNS